jgi:hypothetical protein
MSVSDSDKVIVELLMLEFDNRETLTEMPWIIPDNPTLIPGTELTVRKSLDLRLERDPRTRRNQKKLMKSLMDCGLVFQTTDGTWVHISGPFPDAGKIRRATTEDKQKCMHLPKGWEKVLKVDNFGE